MTSHYSADWSILMRYQLVLHRKESQELWCAIMIFQSDYKGNTLCMAPPFFWADTVHLLPSHVILFVYFINRMQVYLPQRRSWIYLLLLYKNKILKNRLIWFVQNILNVGLIMNLILQRV